MLPKGLVSIVTSSPNWVLSSTVGRSTNRGRQTNLRFLDAAIVKSVCSSWVVHKRRERQEENNYIFCTLRQNFLLASTTRYTWIQVALVGTTASRMSLLSQWGSYREDFHFNFGCSLTSHSYLYKRVDESSGCKRSAVLQDYLDVGSNEAILVACASIWNVA